MADGIRWEKPWDLAPQVKTDSKHPPQNSNDDYKRIVYKVSNATGDLKITVSEFNNNFAMHYAIPKSELAGCTNVRLVIDVEKYAEGAAAQVHFGRHSSKRY